MKRKVEKTVKPARPATAKKANTGRPSAPAKKKKTAKSVAPETVAGLAKATKEIEPYLKKFEEYLAKSMRYLIKAAKVYEAAVNKFGRKVTDAAFGEKFPFYTHVEWELMAKIAKREFSPKIFIVAKQSLVHALSALSYDDQVKVLGDVDEPMPTIPCLSRGNSVQYKTVNRMNAAEISSIIDKNAGRLRTLAEQVAANEARKKEKEEAKIWEVVDGVLSVHKACIISGDDLKRLFIDLSMVFQEKEASK